MIHEFVSKFSLDTMTLIINGCGLLPFGAKVPLSPNPCFVLSPF